jgi:hypothetical protein
MNESIQQLSSNIDTHFDDLPVKLVEVLLDRFQVAGVIPFTSGDIRNLVLEVLDSPGGRFSEISSQLSALVQQQTSLVSHLRDQSLGVANSSFGNGSAAAAPSPNYSGEIHMWPNCPRFHMVPFGFKWPSYTTNTVMNLWFFGDPSRRICAFRHIPAKFDLTTPACKINCSRANRVITKLIQMAITEKLINTANDVSKSNIQSIYDFAYPKLIAELYGDEESKRPNDININTLSNRLGKRQ